MLIRGVLAALIVIAGLISSAERAFASRLAIDGSRLLYIAEKGERNVVSVSSEADRYIVRDTGATIRVPAPCELMQTSQNAPARASCPAAGLAILGVNAGDANDSVDIGNGVPASVVVGGAGDDQVEGGPGPDQIDGGEGSDVLVGRGGNDVVAGGPGPDWLRGDAGDDLVAGGADDDAMRADAGADTLDGGPGTDGITYDERTAPVSVTLDGVANDGERGEGDNVQRTVERVLGGRANDFISGQSTGTAPGLGVVLEGEGGDDVLTGGLGADDIEGGPGSDRISGGAGPDVLTGGPGSDLIAGEGGDDLVDAADGTNDRIDCGPGNDSAWRDRSDAGAQRCEVRVAGGTPSGVSQSDVAGFYRFSRARLLSRRGQRVVAFTADIPGDRRTRRQSIWIRVTFLTTRRRAVGRRMSCEVLIRTRSRTEIAVRRVPGRARRVRISVDTDPPVRAPRRPACRKLR